MILTTKPLPKTALNKTKNNLENISIELILIHTNIQIIILIFVFEIM